jgi:hypothetical protein
MVDEVTDPKYAPITEEDEWFVGTKALFEFVIVGAGDMTGWGLEFVVKNAAAEEEKLISKTVGDGITITDGPNRTFRVTVDAGDTLGWRGGWYDYAVVRTDTDQEQLVLFGPALIRRAAAP